MISKNAVNRIRKINHRKWTFLFSCYQPDSFLFLSFWSDWAVALSVWLLAVSFDSRGIGNVPGRGSGCVTYPFCFCVSFNNLESHHSFARTSFKSGGSWIINTQSYCNLQYNLWRNAICSCAPYNNVVIICAFLQRYRWLLGNVKTFLSDPRQPEVRCFLFQYTLTLPHLY